MINRLIQLRRKLAEKKLDGLLISSVSNIIYLTNYSGFSKEEREAFLFIAKNKQYILTDGRYSEAVKSLLPNFKLIEISAKLSFEDALKNIITKNKIKKLGFEGHDLAYFEHNRLSKHFKNLKHISLSSLREIKTKDEISKIKKACELSDKTFEHVLTCINAGITEKELAFEIEFFIKKHGAEISFPPIVAFGKNSAFPHHKTSDKRLTTKDLPSRKAGKFVLLDFGVKLNNYCSDMTRTIFFGKPTLEQKKMYQTVLEAQKLAIEKLNILISQYPSIPASKIDKAARDYIISKGYKTIPHGLGHGIGIEVHEAPKLSQKSKDVLKPGMVFTIEPGIYVPNFGGVRIEDVVALEKPYPRLLTKSSRELTMV